LFWVFSLSVILFPQYLQLFFPAKFYVSYHTLMPNINVPKLNV